MPLQKRRFGRLSLSSALTLVIATTLVTFLLATGTSSMVMAQSPSQARPAHPVDTNADQVITRQEWIDF